jgi:DNA-binding beta-propeller fold protein YncE
LIFEYDFAGSGKAVTTDKAGNVYVAGVDVSEYPQGVNSAFSCEVPNAAPRSIAVDKDGDVFVGAFLSNARGKIVEYVHGLADSQCSATRLPIKFSSVPAGIAFDKNGNLLVTDPQSGGGDIDVIAPPYTSITGRINSRGPWPLAVALNRANTRLYVTDSSLNVVQVLSYPSGAPLTTLDDAQDLAQPTSAVDSANFVP